jgi:enoyl-CoA hydratase/carnithine racemase
LAFENILLERAEAGIARVTLNRPDKRNPMFRETLHELQAAFRALNDDPEARVVILTARGSTFVAGADVNVLLNAESIWENRAYLSLIHETYGMIERLAQPVIAAVNGLATGAGAELVVTCDFAIAGESARFAMPEVPLGMISAIQSALFAHAAPIGRVREWLYTGDEIDAREAERWGFVNRVVADEDLQEEALRAARKIAQAPPLAVRLQKELINGRWLRSDLDTAMRDSIEFSTLAHTTGEAKRLVSARRAALRAAKAAPGPVPS